MKKLITLAILALMPMGLAHAEAIPGKPAPAFEVKDANGKTRTLSENKGKWVVLEWFNKDCPYVKKHYDSNNMQGLQKNYTGKGVIWYTVVSSAKGKQGHQSPADTLKTATEKKAAASAILLDESGVMGKAYGAKTTPHMYVIDPSGNVVYAGGIDNNDSSDPKVIPASTNYVSAALDAGMANKKIEVSSARPYGCSVKYQ
ncbi:alkyl hydroperoxide reductase [Bdellovibrio bacteriovorus]|uniref:Alkyl hydroperoxide reductase n=1 Tax=Bdellovibrio bacteriovorus TaxID=959 RepID=A0A150WQC7_BDEBC|nr:thioredoxin family protein [Bdellovibrio bacteriovorus]KYG66499.1 alkyl hydroperoxide reductase [Bdellovibrio bacteriovorus]